MTYMNVVVNVLQGHIASSVSMAFFPPFGGSELSPGRVILWGKHAIDGIRQISWVVFHPDGWIIGLQEINA